MSQSANRVLVYADTDGEPVLVGTLIVDAASRRRAGVSSTFTYDPTWLARPDAYAIDPHRLSLDAPRPSLSTAPARSTTKPLGWSHSQSNAVSACRDGLR